MNETLAHLARDMGQYLMLVLQLDMKHRAGQNFGHDTFDINELVYHIIVTIAFYHLATQLPRAPTVANPISRTGSVGTFNKPHSSTERKPRDRKSTRLNS